MAKRAGHLSQWIPDELKKLDQWLGWKTEKRPRVCFDDFRFASTSTETDYSPYNLALAAVANGDLDGLGFTVTPYDPFTIIDLDGCFTEDGDLSPFAREIVDRVDSYTEISNSGRGLHVVIKGILAANYKRIKRADTDPPPVEFFGTAGYVILTGRLFENRGTLRKIPSTELSSLITDTGATAAVVKQYLSTDAPEDLPDVDIKDFEQANVFGRFMGLVATGAEPDQSLVGRLPRDRDGGLDRSRAIFGAAHQAKDAGAGAVRTYALLKKSAWVTEYTDEKSPGWLWRYVIEPVFKGADGEVPVREAGKRAKFITGWELLQSIRPVDWLVEGFLEKGAVGLLVGKHSSYKSAVALDWAHCIATGTPWLGAHKVNPGPVVIIAGEGSRGLARRSHAWFQSHDVNPEDGFPTIWSTSEVRIMDQDEQARSVAQIRELLDKECEGKEPAMVLVDTLAKNFIGGDENSAADTGQFFGDLSRCFPKSCVLVVHHQGKDASKGSRGSSAIEAGVDFAYKATVRSGNVKLDCLKMKDADRPLETFLSPEVVELELDLAEGEKTTGVTVRPSFKRDRARDTFSHMRKHAETALEIYRVLEQSGPLEKSSLADLFHGKGAFGGFEKEPTRRQLFGVLKTMAETDLVTMENGKIYLEG